MSTSFIIMVMMVETRNESRDLCCVPYSHACIFIHSFCMNAWFCRCIRVGKISSTFIYKTKRFRQSSWHNCDAWFLQWVKRMALTETNIFVPQKWMVGVLWSNIVFFWGGHPWFVSCELRPTGWPTGWGSKNPEVTCQSLHGWCVEASLD